MTKFLSKLLLTGTAAIAVSLFLSAPFSMPVQARTVVAANPLEDRKDAAAERRKEFVSFAQNAAGKIPYCYGGSAWCRGWAGVPSCGFDCSGFVQWVYWSVYGVCPGRSTYTLTASLGLESISRDALQPGDLGLVSTALGGSYDHIGIFVGYDSAGNTLWCHASSSKGVTISVFPDFDHFYSLD